MKGHFCSSFFSSSFTQCIILRIYLLNRDVKHAPISLGNRLHLSATPPCFLITPSGHLHIKCQRAKGWLAEADDNTTTTRVGLYRTNKSFYLALLTFCANGTEIDKRVPEFLTPNLHIFTHSPNTLTRSSNTVRGEIRHLFIPAS